MAATDWRQATVERIRPETPRAATITLAVPEWSGHRAGQHVDVRLTAEDGYQAQRRYSIASAPDDGPPQITVVEVDMGEVSPWMVSVAREADVFEVRGPFGGWFVWDPPAVGEVLMVGGGSGLVPLMSMLRAGTASRVYVCGPTAFVESVANDLVALGHDPANIRTERFG